MKKHPAWLPHPFQSKAFSTALTLAASFLSAALLLSLSACSPPDPMQHDWGISADYAGRRSYDEMSTLLNKIADPGFIDLQIAGRSPEGRNIYLLQGFAYPCHPVRPPRRSHQRITIS